MAPFFYGWGSTASRLEPLRGGSLLFTTKFPETPGTPLVHLCKMLISPGDFLHFFKILIFLVVSGVKEQKMTQNKKKIFLSHFISPELYII